MESLKSFKIVRSFSYYADCCAFTAGCWVFKFNLRTHFHLAIRCQEAGRNSDSSGPSLLAGRANESLEVVSPVQLRTLTLFYCFAVSAKIQSVFLRIGTEVDDARGSNLANLKVHYK